MNKAQTFLLGALSVAVLNFITFVGELRPMLLSTYILLVIFVFFLRELGESQ